MKSYFTLRNILIAIPLASLLAALHYALPQVDVVRAVGVEIKRVDVQGADSSQQRTRDVYQLQTETLKGEPRVFRNEDNILYGKFGSADLQARMQSASRDGSVVAVRHYGWRIRLLSVFPNALKVWRVDADYRHVPVFNLLALLALGLVGFLGFRKIQNFRTARAEARAEREAERARATEEASRRAEEARANKPQDRARQEEVDAFLNSDET